MVDMKCFKYLIINILLVYNFTVFSQRTETYEGAFLNGKPYPSTVRYGYYLNTEGKQIKHGSFRYLVKEKNEDMRMMHNFTGNFQHGKKDGKWEYTIKNKDMGNSQSKFLESAEIQLFANYKDGLPHGKWVYKSYITKRRKIVINGKEKYEDFQVVKNVSITINFSNGILVDSAYFLINELDTIQFFADASGFVHGNYHYTKSKEVIGFDHGLLSEKDGIKTSEYLFYQQPKNRNSITSDTVTLLDDKKIGLRKLLIDNVFNSDYFLYDRIEGDLIVVQNSRGHFQSVDLNGYFILKLKPALSESQAKFITDSYYYHRKINDLLLQAKRELQNAPSNSSLKNRVGALTDLLNQSEKVYKTAKLVEKDFLPSRLVEKSKQFLNPLPAGLGDIQSAEEFLKLLLETQKSLFNKADKLSKI